MLFLPSVGALSNLPFLRRWLGSQAAQDLQVRPARSNELEAAVRFILSPGNGFAADSQVADFVHLAMAAAGPAGGLWVAYRRGVMQSAVLPVVSPGRTMLVFTPQQIGDESRQLATKLVLEAACCTAARNGQHLAQVLVEPSDTLQVELLQTCGFERLAELIYLQKVAAQSARPPELAADMQWENYSARQHELFGRTILSVYAESLDCPRLSGLRDIEDVIAGHKAAGEFDPRMWFVLMERQTPLGVLLLSSILRTDAVEVVYLGVVPKARGKGVGDILMRQAMATVVRHGHSRLSLAVDAGNIPALKLYWRHGMQTVGRKIAVLRDLRLLVHS